MAYPLSLRSLPASIFLVAWMTATPLADAEQPIKKIRIGLISRQKGTAYFNAIYEGAKKGAVELGDVELFYDGPSDDSPEKETQLIEQLIAKRVDALAVAGTDPPNVAPVLKKARLRGIKVVTWDYDESRDSLAPTELPDFTANTQGSAKPRPWAILLSALRASVRADSKVRQTPRLRSGGPGRTALPL
jgi:ABC-type sugar transport system substrate-binding protein